MPASVDLDASISWFMLSLTLSRTTATSESTGMLNAEAHSITLEIEESGALHPCLLESHETAGICFTAFIITRSYRKYMNILPSSMLTRACEVLPITGASNFRTSTVTSKPCLIANSRPARIDATGSLHTRLLLSHFAPLIAFSSSTCDLSNGKSKTTSFFSKYNFTLVFPSHKTGVDTHV